LTEFVWDYDLSPPQDALLAKSALGKEAMLNTIAGVKKDT
jgi:hypothetical protein